MTDEEKKEKEYRDKLVEDCMKYNHIDYDDDKDIVETMVEAIASEELMELIPNFDPYNLTARQRLLVYSFVKELYDQNSIHVEVCKNILLFCLDSLFLCLCCCIVPVLQFRKHRIDNVLCGCSFDALRNMVVFFKII